jgi:signal transduction histidine kinase
VGLAMALRVYTSELQERTGLPICFVEDAALPQLSSEQGIAAYRICQESLTNVLRHSRATGATVSLIVQDGRVELQVEDNGQGFVPGEDSSRRSLGLLGMEERADLVNAELSITSTPGLGTTVTLRLPMFESSMATEQ